MTEATILEGVIIGAAGGAAAGIVIWSLELARKAIIKKCDTNKVEKWLKLHTIPNHTEERRSTVAIASHNDLTVDRVRFICSYSSKIQLNSKDGNDSKEMWKFKN